MLGRPSGKVKAKDFFWSSNEQLHISFVSVYVYLDGS